MKDQFHSNLFLVEEKDGGYRHKINLKRLKSFKTYQHVKMEGLHMLKDLLQKGKYLCKKDLKHAYFCVPLGEKSRKYLRF